MRTLLIDGGYVTHVAAAVAPGKAGEVAVRMVRNLLRQLEGTRAVVAIDCPREECFRRALFAGYKANRPSPCPPVLHPARAGLEAEFVCRSLPGLEADDVLGILATCDGMEGERVIVAADKDLMAVPGLHCNPRAKPPAVVAVSERDADYNHMRQTLTGCSGDGYPGCPGVGPAKAEQVLSYDPRNWWGQVVGAFRSKGMTEADALLQARLARICRAADYDIEGRRVVPWTPAVYQPVAAVGGAA